MNGKFKNLCILAVASLLCYASFMHNAHATLKIMPLGDSLTAGGYNQDGQWNIGGGYRVKLGSTLKQAGLDFVFVGSLHDGPVDFVNNAHEGHSGFRIEQVTAQVAGWLTATNPDLILLMMGTNDIIQDFDLPHAGDRYDALLDAIEQASPHAKIIVASPIPTENEDWNSSIVDLSNSIIDLVAKHSQAGHPIQFVDMYNAAGIVHDRSDLIDGVHPNPTAYEKLAPVWVNAVLDIRRR